jgi:hypothetical protein
LLVGSPLEMTTDISEGWEDIQGKRFPGYGRCTYCGSDGGADGLGEEHVVPLSLNGETVIDGASCKTCEALISPADTYLGKSVYWHFRLHTGANTRRPKERPSVLKATVEISGKETEREFPVKEMPFAVAMPIWGDAGFFRSAAIDAPFPETFLHLYHWEPPDIRDRLNLAEDEAYKIWSKINLRPDLFARAIAKIAYCHMVIQYGLDGFRKLALPDVILGKCPAAAYFVDVPLRVPPPPLARNALHMVRHVDLTSKFGPLKLHLVYVRLFANSAYKEHGMPIYYVIAGARKPPKRRPR